MSRNKKEKGTSLTVRLISLFLAALMVLGVVYTAVVFIIDASAADEKDPLAAYAMAGNVGDRNFPYSAAVIYGSGVQVYQSFTSPHGIVIGEGYIDRTYRYFKPLMIVDDTVLSVCCDGNLQFGYNTCSFAGSEKDTDIGGYHVDLVIPDNRNNIDIWTHIETLKSLFYEKYEQIFPAYIDDEKHVRIGAFTNYTKASEAAAAVANTVDGYTISVASPVTEATTFVNEDNDTILFEYSGGPNHYGGVCAVQEPGTDYAFIVSVSKDIRYDGAFLLRRWISDTNDGLELISLVPMNKYIEGVLPAEVYPTWPIESLKAFAITARSYAIANRGKRMGTYGCDLLASSNDQNYRGRYKVNDSVMTACSDTEGQLLTFNGDCIAAYYCSSTGGCTVDTQYVWGGGTESYICSQVTPWENYSAVAGGLWTKEISPKDLATQLKNKNSSYMSGTEVRKIEAETTGDSYYNYRLTITDNKNKVTTITKCSNITGAMKTNSANFVVGKGSVVRTYDEVLSVEIIDLDKNYSGNLSVQTKDGVASTTGSLLQFITGLGSRLKDSSGAMYVMTDKGTAVLASEHDIPITTLPDNNGNYTYVSDYGSFLIVSKLREHTETVKASSSSNWIIAGKGYGHGVGASQYGMSHLSQAGALAKHILYAYFPGTEITTFAQYFKTHTTS